MPAFFGSRPFIFTFTAVALVASSTAMANNLPFISKTTAPEPPVEDQVIIQKPVATPSPAEPRSSALPPAGTKVITLPPAMMDPPLSQPDLPDTPNIMALVGKSANHKTLLKAVLAADLDTTLARPGPITLFAPTDQAFGRLPARVLADLMAPQNKAVLGRILGHHAVAGIITSDDLAARIKAGGGKASLTTLAGETLIAEMTGSTIALRDKAGNKARLTASDLNASNGRVHVIDNILLPQPDSPPQ